MTKTRGIGLIALLLSLILLPSSCTLLSPTPTNEQIIEAIHGSLQKESTPPELSFSDMQVPHRFPGKASAVLWTEDETLQRNYTIVFDKKEKIFYVESYFTLYLGEDGVFREENL